MTGSPEKQHLHKLVIGALKATVNDHGKTVEDSWYNSAAKRIVSQILASDRLNIEYVAVRKHWLACDEYHAHEVPKCCHLDCWCLTEKKETSK